MTIIETMIIHAPAIRVGARLVIAFDAAMPAKQMLRLPAAEPVARQIAIALQQGEMLVRHDEMQKAGPRTNRTIAVEHIGLGFDRAPEADRAAMATAVKVRSGHGVSSNIQIWRVP